jgi:multidrug resistance efflux pump
MSDSAQVTAIDAINDLRVALVCFGEAAAEALVAAEAEVRRTEEWVEDQLKSWQQEVRQCEDEVFQAKTELTRRKMLSFGDRPVDTTDQEVALRRAVARLEHAQDQVEVSRRWVRQWPHEINEYRGPTGQLKGLLEGELPRACTLLERKIASLQTYVTTASPSTPAPQAAASSVPAKPREERPQP